MDFSTYAVSSVFKKTKSTEQVSVCRLDPGCTEHIVCFLSGCRAVGIGRFLTQPAGDLGEYRIGMCFKGGDCPVSHWGVPPALRTQGKARECRSVQSWQLASPSQRGSPPGGGGFREMLRPHMGEVLGTCREQTRGWVEAAWQNLLRQIIRPLDSGLVGCMCLLYHPLKMTLGPHVSLSPAHWESPRILRDFPRVGDTTKGHLAGVSRGG